MEIHALRAGAVRDQHNQMKTEPPPVEGVLAQAGKARIVAEIRR